MNSVTPASRACRTRTRSVCPLSMMIGTNWSGLSGDVRIWRVSSIPSIGSMFQSGVDDVHGMRTQLLHRGGTVDGLEDRADAERLQDVPDQAAHRLVVLGNEDRQLLEWTRHLFLPPMSGAPCHPDATGRWSAF